MVRTITATHTVPCSFARCTSASRLTSCHQANTKRAIRTMLHTGVFSASTTGLPEYTEGPRQVADARANVHPLHHDDSEQVRTSGVTDGMAVRSNADTRSMSPLNDTSAYPRPGSSAEPYQASKKGRRQQGSHFHKEIQKSIMT